MCLFYYKQLEYSIGELMDIYIKARDLLKMASFVWELARLEGFRLPKFVNQKSKAEFQNITQTFFYGDPQSVSNLEFILGNSSRWDQNLCRFFSIGMLNYFIEEANELTLLKENFRFPKAKSLNSSEEVPLLDYSAGEVSSNYSYTGAVLQLNPRNISIRAKIIYPNLTQAKKTGNPNLAMPKWFTMRYKTSNAKRRKGEVKLQPLPEFKIENFSFYDNVAKRTKFDSRVIPQKKELEKTGRLAKFSYCNLADQLKCLLKFAIKNLEDKKIPSYTAAKDCLLNSLYSKDCFDLINLCIPNANYAFYITKELQPIADAIRVNPANDLTITVFTEDQDFVGNFEIEELKDMILNFGEDFSDCFFVATPFKYSNLEEELLNVEDELEIMSQAEFLDLL